MSIPAAVTGTSAAVARPQIDLRGARFAAALTTVLLAVALVVAPSVLTVGLLLVQAGVFVVVALAGYLAGVGLLGSVATGVALAAAFLNAVFGLCLGCEVFLLVRRIAPHATHI